VTQDGLPVGWSIELDSGARRTDHGQVLIGGSPLRVLRLTRAGAHWLDAMVAGRRMPDSAPSRNLASRLVDCGLANPRPVADGRLTRQDVAVVIPVRDATAGLIRTLDTVSGLADDVVVVDDGSADADAVRRAAFGTTLLRNDAPQGPAAARQAGWQATNRPIILFLDTDISAEPGWLAPLLAHLADPTVGAVAPRVRCRPDAGPRWLKAYEAARSPLDLGERAAPVRPGTRVPYVPSATLAVRREALESVGGFDTSLHTGEDVDLTWRLDARGWRVRYEPASVVSHPNRPTLRSWIRQRVTYGTSAAALARRHGDKVAPLRVSGWSAAAWSAVLVGQPLLGISIGVSTTAALTPKLRGLEHPVAEALRIAGLGHLWAGTAVAEALRRPWWPLSAVVAVTCPRARPALLAAVTVPPLLEWRSRRPGLDPLRFLLLRLLDDLAYGTGVAMGCLETRSVRALLPSFSGPIPPPTPIDVVAS